MSGLSEAISSVQQGQVLKKEKLINTAPPPKLQRPFFAGTGTAARYSNHAQRRQACCYLELNITTDCVWQHQEFSAELRGANNTVSKFLTTMT